MSNAAVVQQSDPLTVTVTRAGAVTDEWAHFYAVPWAFPGEFSIIQLDSAAWRFHGTILVHA